MGTNFYTLGNKHIGKRSAAGLYCWDCKVTLCAGGEEKIHYGCRDISHPPFCNCGWLKECPECGEKPVVESLSESTAGRELGFNKEDPKEKTGVKSCCSFSWAMSPDLFDVSKMRFIKDEYGDRFTREEFEEILKECPVRYYKTIGMEFS
jgi:hypothetical protein